ncbi:hypothetical protein QA648_33345 (plasmid) [Rhizobium sp. CB3171]|uniref:hypothetical protein n=1 Tax=Rhizobium sp. CB3171 TaxID=3039157 RepID=UPI0024B242A5|nr:hypothetical protein [Rhizobium sp. CB3171]WFU06690.1 hypothetical protein QA648_33345 [Rhizobium sp. CB3171]
MDVSAAGEQPCTLDADHLFGLRIYDAFAVADGCAQRLDMSLEEALIHRPVNYLIREWIEDDAELVLSYVHSPRALLMEKCAIVIPGPRHIKLTAKERFSARAVMVGGTSVLQGLLSQLARVGVQKTIILGLGGMGEVDHRFCHELYGMELRVRPLRTPYPGRLIDVATAEEVADVNGVVLIFTEDMAISFTMLERLVRSSYRNIVVASQSPGKRSLRVLTGKAQRLTAIIPEGSDSHESASADLSLVGVYKFDAALVRRIALRRQRRSHDDPEFFEAAFGFHGHPIYVMCADPSEMTVNNDIHTARF